jgi:hypothetical protein
MGTRNLLEDLAIFSEAGTEEEAIELINNQTFNHLINLQKHKIYDREGESLA